MYEACYLLDAGKLNRSSTWEALLDQERLLKYRGLRNGKTALQSLGAGVLLQLAAGEFLLRDKNTLGPDTGKERCFAKLSYERESFPIPFLEVSEEQLAIRWPEILNNLLDRGEALLSYRGKSLSDKKDDWQNQFLNLSYRYNESGKPFFANLPLYFSLSHSGNMILCACSERELGADVQIETGQNWRSLTKRFFSEEERAYLGSLTDEAEAVSAFYRLWTRKEAYGKLTGEGLLNALNASMLEEGGEVFWKDGSFVMPDGKKYYFAVCTKAG